MAIAEDWFCALLVTRFCVVLEVCVWIIVRLEVPNMANYKISNRFTYLFFTEVLSGHALL